MDYFKGHGAEVIAIQVIMICPANPWTIISGNGLSTAPFSVEIHQRIMKLYAAVRVPGDTIHHVDQTEDVDFQAGFFAYFAQASFADGFVYLLSATRDAPAQLPG